MNIQDVIGKIFGSRERPYYMGSNYYFVPRQTNISHSTPNYGPRKYNFEVDYYRQIYCSPEKLSHIRKMLENQVKK